MTLLHTGRRHLGRVLRIARKYHHEKSLPDPCHRRSSGARLQGLSASFFRRQEAVLTPLMTHVARSRGIDPELLLGHEQARAGERLVEYPFALKTLLEAAGEQKISLLDVGCALNNPAVADYLSDITDCIWFLNPSVETLLVPPPVAYVVSDIRDAPLPDHLKWDFVTCLSVLEHVGMDNTRYGGGPAEFEGECRNPHRYAIEAALAILRLVAPGGSFLFSVPYGVFEYVYDHDEPEAPIYYSFNHQQLQEFLEAVDGFDLNATIYKVVPEHGWTETDPSDSEITPYAKGCSGAGAVALIHGQRL